MIVETMTFRLRDGTDEDGFIAMDAHVQKEFFHTQDGFLRRTTARSTGVGEWIAVTLWSSLECAATAAHAAKRDEVAAAFGRLIDPSSVAVARYETLD